MKLYTYFRSSTSYRLRIALAYKNLRYQAEYVSLPAGAHDDPAYRALNPQGLLPTLIDDDGAVVTQSLAILEYLEEKYPRPALLPTDLAGKTYVREISQLIACEMHAPNNLRILKYLGGPLGQDEGARNAWYRHWVAEGFGRLEAFLRARGLYGRFCHGDRPTLADVCLVPQVFNARRFDCPLDAYPELMRIHDECMSLEAFSVSAPGSQPDAV